MIPGNQPDRRELSAYSGSDLDRANSGRIGLRLELQMELAIGRRRNVFERANIGGAGANFSDYIEVVQQRDAVRRYVKDEAGLAAARDVVFAIESLGEVEAMFLYPEERKRNVIGECAFPAAAEQASVVGSRDMVAGRFKEKPRASALQKSGRSARRCQGGPCKNRFANLRGCGFPRRGQAPRRSVRTGRPLRA